jgi:phytoene dehydrogenase-like protein
VWSEFDAVIIGSGINSLVCAALLARKGRRVCVLERNALAGGCIRTEELTFEGFRHDTLSTLYPLFVTSPHFPLLEEGLAANGARFVNCDTPTAVLMEDGRSLILSRDREVNAQAFDRLAPGDGAAYREAMAEVEGAAPLLFGLLGNELWSAATLKLLLKQAWARGARGLAGFFGSTFASCRDWLESSVSSEVTRALFAPWVLHVGLGPESALSAQMNKLILFTLEQAGSPMVSGGSFRIVQAFQSLIEGSGGAVRTGADVESIVVQGGRATGVRLSSGEMVSAREAVIANVTPTQLYGRLLSPADTPDDSRAEARRYRYGRGEMQIHLALDEPPQWPDAELLKVAMLHVTSGLDGVSRAVNEAERGLLPAEATIVVAQPVALDATRAPEGSWIFWIQLQELPRDGELKGDALGEIEVPADGRWTPEVREAYADRIVRRLAAKIPNLERSILGRRVISPRDLAELNMNLVGGDPYSGSCSLDQFMLWRPSKAARNHQTPVTGLFHIGASTHPGPGLGGMSGFMVARRVVGV